MNTIRTEPASRSSRERIIRLLLRDPRTIEDLAASLGVTRNAVRSQIALLIREGMVEVRGEVKGRRRPAALYGLHTDAEVHRSQAYPAVLAHLVGTLSAEMDGSALEAVLRETGRRMVQDVPQFRGTVRQRVDNAVRYLGSLGAVTEAIEENGTFLVKGHGCPLSKAVAADGRACLVMVSLLERLTGLPVQERCDHGARPGCAFVIGVRGRKEPPAPQA